ncbi:MAG: hypothetical protein L3J24_07855 [Xanthomonadales bacterium]|nr:hypothetical protein [Xanthomonadales bacterium]
MCKKNEFRQLMFALICLSLASAASAANHFEASFNNNSSSEIRAVVMKADGSGIKNYRLKPGSSRAIDFNVKNCNQEKVRSFIVYSNAGTKLAQGQWTMLTGRKRDGHCQHNSLTFDRCNDLDASDALVVTCNTEPEHDEELGHISIEDA